MDILNILQDLYQSHETLVSKMKETKNINELSTIYDELKAIEEKIKNIKISKNNENLFLLFVQKKTIQKIQIERYLLGQRIGK